MGNLFHSIDMEEVVQNMVEIEKVEFYSELSKMTSYHAKEKVFIKNSFIAKK